MENRKQRIINGISWVIVLAVMANFFINLNPNAIFKPLSAKPTKELLEKIMKPSGPIMFWRGDSLDVHGESAGFMQFVSLYSAHYSKSEALTKTFTCVNQDFSERIDFQIKPIDIPKAEYAMPEKLFMIHLPMYNFSNAKKLLLNNGIIDKKNNWTFGKGHLVIDYSANLNQEASFINWYFYKLEQEARKAGGFIHIIVNSSTLNMLDKKHTKYNRTGYSETFVHLHNWESDTFIQNNSEIGRWLFSKNVVEKIGDFVIANTSFQSFKDNSPLDSVNQLFRDAYFKGTTNKYGSFILTDSQATHNRFLNYHGTNLTPSTLLGNRVHYYFGDEFGDRIAYFHSEVDALLLKFNAKHVIALSEDPNDSIFLTPNNKYIGYSTDVSKRSFEGFTNQIRYTGLFFNNNNIYSVNDEGVKTLIHQNQ